MRLRPWTPDAIAAESVRLNRMVDGGFVTITAHPIFGHGRWVVRIESADLKWDKATTIGTDPSLSRAIEQAWKWIEDNRPRLDLRKPESVGREMTDD